MGMNRWISALVIAAALGGVDVPVALAAPEASAEGWRVLEKRGRVRYRPAGEHYWWTARTDTEIPGGSSVAADGNGFLIIARAGESITVHPHSRLELPGGPSGDRSSKRLAICATGSPGQGQRQEQG